MTLIRNITINLLVLCVTTTLYSQVNDSKAVLIKGQVVSEMSKPVSFAHVINVSQNYATITDSTGYFKLPATQGDSIKISSVGYFTKHIPIETIKSDALKIVLKSRTYSLSEVNINEIRWQVFKSEFMEKEIKENKTQKRASIQMKKWIPLEEIRMIRQNANRKDWLYLDKYKR
jgi:hypothetical protein